MKKNDFVKSAQGFESDALYEKTVLDIIKTKDGEGTPLPKELADYIAKVGKVAYMCSTYPFAMSEECGSFMEISCDAFPYAPTTYEELVMPMCGWLVDIENSGEFHHSTHSTEEVIVGTVNIGLSKDGSCIGCTMVLES